MPARFAMSSALSGEAGGHERVGLPSPLQARDGQLPPAVPQANPARPGEAAHGPRRVQREHRREGGRLREPIAVQPGVQTALRRDAPRGGREHAGSPRGRLMGLAHGTEQYPQRRVWATTFSLKDMQAENFRFRSFREIARGVNPGGWPVTRHIRSSDPRILTRKCCDRFRSVGAYWVLSQLALCSPHLRNQGSNPSNRLADIGVKCASGRLFGSFYPSRGAFSWQAPKADKNQSIGNFKLNGNRHFSDGGCRS